MPRSRIISRGRRTPPNRSWSASFGATYIAVPAASKVLLGSFALTTPADVTILRTVGTISVKSDQVAVSEEQVGAFGMQLVTGIALAVGITAIPGPVTDAADDGWFIYQSFGQSWGSAGATFAGGPEALTYQFDSKAKRKVDDSLVMAVVVENAHATHAFEIWFAVRILAMIRGT